MMRNQLHMGLMVVISILSLPPLVCAEVVFSENWNGETTGDQIHELEQWNDRGGFGEIMEQAGDKYLQLLDPSPGTFSWITSKESFSFGQGAVVSLTSEVTLRGAADTAYPARLGFRGVSPENRYLVNLFPDKVNFWALGTENRLLGTKDVDLGTDQAHTVRMMATHNVSTIDFDVQLDGVSLFSPTDTAPLLNSTTDAFNLQLTTWKPMAADFDDISFSQVPEPSSFLLFGPVLLAFVGHRLLRHRCRGRKG
jgi:hypothetical protein